MSSFLLFTLVAAYLFVMCCVYFSCVGYSAPIFCLVSSSILCVASLSSRVVYSFIVSLCWLSAFLSFVSSFSSLLVCLFTDCSFSFYTASWFFSQFIGIICILVFWVVICLIILVVLIGVVLFCVLDITWSIISISFPSLIVVRLSYTWLISSICLCFICFLTSCVSWILRIMYLFLCVHEP